MLDQIRSEDRNKDSVANQRAYFSEHHVASVEDTVAFARQYAAELAAGDVIALCGDLGAGKTHFTVGLAAGLGFADVVTSPTFTLVHEYVGGRLPVFHFDFYRLEDRDAVIALGWDEYFDQDGVIVVEWADKFRELLPDHTRWISVKESPQGGRLLCMEA